MDSERSGQVFRIGVVSSKGYRAFRRKGDHSVRVVLLVRDDTRYVGSLANEDLALTMVGDYISFRWEGGEVRALRNEEIEKNAGRPLKATASGAH